MNDDIGDRFKRYEACFDYTLPQRLPLVIRVDGRAFHSIKLDKPFDHKFVSCMSATATALCREIQGSVLAYFQSDEISIIARDDMENTTQPWVGKKLSKIISISAAIATATFNEASGLCWGSKHFDSRAFVVPDLNEVTNYLIWRQQDATRNSVSMTAHAEFSHSSLHKKSTKDMLDMLRAAGKPWEEIPTQLKRGMICRPVIVWKAVPQGHGMYKTWGMYERREWQVDKEMPILTEDRDYIEALFRKGLR